ncbi:hypothetical protein [Cupriavidus sp.]|uniref:hypothetical protein n=1 Tax=Cupriavidus sp. TaxID=1873897 RepID=UPI003D0A7517
MTQAHGADRKGNGDGRLPSPECNGSALASARPASHRRSLQARPSSRTRRAGPRHSRRARLERVSTAVFASPNLATVGLCEREARARHTQMKVYKSTFRPLRERMSEHDGKVFIKLVVAGAEERVVGVHMVGPDAGEIIQGVAVALTCGATKAQFDATPGNHPTIAEECVRLR